MKTYLLMRTETRQIIAVDSVTRETVETFPSHGAATEWIAAHPGSSPAVYSGSCRYCGSPRPEGYMSTCGASHCQEANYHDQETRRPVKGRRS